VESGCWRGGEGKGGRGVEEKAAGIKTGELVNKSGQAKSLYLLWFPFVLQDAIWLVTLVSRDDMFGGYATCRSHWLSRERTQHISKNV